MKEKRNIAIFRQLPPGSTPEKIAKEQLRTDARARVLQDFYRMYSRSLYDIDARGFVMLGDEYTGSRTYASGDVGRYMRETGTGDFERTHTHIVGGNSGYLQRCGEAALNTNRSVTFEGTMCGVKTDLHEAIGHAMEGLHHAASYDNKRDRYREYEGNDSIMGNSAPITGFNSVELVRMDLVSEREIVRVTENTQVLLCPVELSADSLRANEHKHAIVNHGGKCFHVSIRKIRGWPWVNIANGEQMLFVHECTADGHSVRQKPWLRYAPDSFKQAQTGLVVEYLEYSDETARVNIIVDEDSLKPKDIPMPTGFATVNDSLTVEHSGVWFNPDFNGQGINVHISGDDVVIHAFSFDETDTARRFYNAKGTTAQMLEGVDITTTEGGTWADPTTHKVVNVGRCQLSAVADELIYSWNTDEYGRGSTRMQRACTLIGDKNDGTYWQKSRDGEGISLHLAKRYVEETKEYENVLLAHWYSYGATGQRWYSCEGIEVALNTYAMEIYEVQDHRWMRLDDESGAIQVGTATVKLADKDNIKFSFDLKTPTLQGAGTYELQRLF